MAIQSTATLKSFFQTGDHPTQANFSDLIDSVATLDSDGNLDAVVIPRNDTAANLNSIVLAAGEFASTTDTHQLRLGDGSTLGGVPYETNPFNQSLNANDSVGFTRVSIAAAGDPDSGGSSGIVFFDDSASDTWFIDSYDVNDFNGQALRIGNQNGWYALVATDDGSQSVQLGGNQVFDNPPALPTLTPASHTAAGTTGQIAWDTNFIYICIGTNSWKRAAITVW